MDENKDGYYAYCISQLEESDDTESAHAQADVLLTDLLEELGYHNTVEAFRNLKKWYA